MPDTAYYNENDPRAAAWLRELIREGLIAPGTVDERSIVDVQPDDLVGYRQVHLFAGIGGWSYALRLAGVPDDLACWTGSCPCQPFSQAGQQRGVDDERHLWPHMRRLVAECQPAICFGEQVASRAGRDWLAGVRADLEELGYAIGAADLCAAGVGAPHIRQRLWWVAHANFAVVRHVTPAGQLALGERDSGAGRLADAGGQRVLREGRGQAEGTPRGVPGAVRQRKRVRPDVGPSSATVAAWTPSLTIDCLDGKARRIGPEPDSFPLAHGVPARVVRLRGYGNAIVPQVAATFIRASLDAIAAPV